MLKRAMLLSFLGALMIPLPATVQHARAGQSSGSGPQEWSVSATIACRRTSPFHLCDLLTGPLVSVAMDMVIDEDNPTPGITFTATYTAIGPPYAPGAGIRPYSRVCAFGLRADHLRLIRGPFDGSTTCRATVRGRMVLQPGAATRLSKTPDFWITSETATVPGALDQHIVDPLGPKAYPADTRIPVRWRAGVTSRNANRTLGVLGAPGFPRRAGPLPRGVSASMTVMNLPLAGAGQTS